jgi:hypothetical protein
MVRLDVYKIRAAFLNALQLGEKTWQTSNASASFSIEPRRYDLRFQRCQMAAFSTRFGQLWRI